MTPRHHDTALCSRSPECKHDMLTKAVIGWLCCDISGLGCSRPSYANHPGAVTVRLWSSGDSARQDTSQSLFPFLFNGPSGGPQYAVHRAAPYGSMDLAACESLANWQYHVRRRCWNVASLRGPPAWPGVVLAEDNFSSSESQRFRRHAAHSATSPHWSLRPRNTGSEIDETKENPRVGSRHCCHSHRIAPSWVSAGLGSPVPRHPS